MSLVQPDIRPIPGHSIRPRYRLERQYICAFKIGNRTTSYTVPEGFLTDGSTEWVAQVVVSVLGALATLATWAFAPSDQEAVKVTVYMMYHVIPSVLLWVFGVRADGPQRAAAVVHDHSIRMGLESRRASDGRFFYILRAAKVPLPYAYMRWAVVRAYSVSQLWRWV